MLLLLPQQSQFSREKKKKVEDNKNKELKDAGINKDNNREIRFHEFVCLLISTSTEEKKTERQIMYKTDQYVSKK